MRTRVLIVDDDAHLTAGLERACRKNARHWELVCVNSAAEALTRLAAQHFDVVVTDLHMPGMNGADLLERIATQFPGTARLVLSGYAEEAIARRAAELAHQFLSKPTEASALIIAVDQAAAMERLIRNQSLQKALTSCKTLPTPPALYLQIVAATGSDSADIGEIATLVQRDISLSAKLLQLINSSFFGIGRRVASVEKAINLLGLTRLKALLLAQDIFRKCDNSPVLSKAAVEGLWHHSFLVGETAMRISKAEGQTEDRPEQAFMAGLLHDAGVLFLAAECPDEFAAITKLMVEKRLYLWQAEANVLGVTHAEVGAGLLSLWGLPPRILEGVMHHHRPTRVEYAGLCAVSTVHIADALISRLIGYDGLRIEGAPLPVVEEAYYAGMGFQEHHPRWQALAEAACATDLHATGALLAAPAV